MNVVRHQAIGDDLNAALARALAQEIKIGHPVVEACIDGSGC
jgi:hypothetical protein